MAKVLQDGDLGCFGIDDDTAVISLAGQKYVLDYSQLMDFLTSLAVVAAQVENAPARGSAPVGLLDS